MSLNRGSTTVDGSSIPRSEPFLHPDETGRYAKEKVDSADACKLVMRLNLH
jgi:hypothetical protein